MKEQLKILRDSIKGFEFAIVQSARLFAASFEYFNKEREPFTPDKAARMIKREGMIEHLNSVINDYSLAQERVEMLNIQAIMIWRYMPEAESMESILDRLFGEEMATVINGQEKA